MVQNATVKLKLRKDKSRKDGSCPINFLIIFNRDNLKLPSKRHLPPSAWDFENDCPKRDKILKSLLEQEKRRIEDFLLELRIAKIPITKEVIKERYYGKTSTHDFYYHFDEFCQRKFLEIWEGTQNHYILLRKQLKEYKPNLLLSELNFRFFEDFFYYLRATKGVGESGIGTRRKNLVTVLNKFVEWELIEKNECKRIPRPKEKSRIDFLTLNEIQKIVDVDLDFGFSSKGLNLTRDWFLFSCYTGLRYSDVCELKVENIIELKRMKLTQIKTNEELDVPLSKNARIMLAKSRVNKMNKHQRIFTPKSNAALNRDLKEIRKIAGIEKPLYFHMGRHSFATNLILNGVPLPFVKDLMGHKDVKMTMRYVNSNYEILKNQIQNIKF